jgi:Na+-transporting methylmalonyl-CoA/oxaloacetate decarboxylase gamma subunit
VKMIAVPALFAVSLPEHPTFADNLQFQLTGLLVVLVTLGTLAILVSLIGRLFSASRPEVAPAIATPAAPPAPEAEGEIPGPVYAAIAAAVASALGDERFAIRGVQAADPRHNLSWGAEGRRAIYASRKLR